MVIEARWSVYEACGRKTWCAKLTGLDRRYGFEREFLGSCGSRQSRSGRTGAREYNITENGWYEVADRDGRQYYRVQDGELKAVSRDEVVAALS